MLSVSHDGNTEVHIVTKWGACRTLGGAQYKRLKSFAAVWRPVPVNTVRTNRSRTILHLHFPNLSFKLI